jgi:PEP-CTERM motif
MGQRRIDFIAYLTLRYGVDQLPSSQRRDVFMRNLIKAALAGFVMAVATSASAATIAKTFTFSASNFVYSVPGVVLPYTSVSGSFTLQFDDTLTYTDETNGITLHSLDLPITPFSLAFSYAPGLPFLNVGGARNGVSVSPIGVSTDFAMSIFNANGPNPQGGMFSYTAPGLNNSVVVANTVRLTAVNAAPAVPEPSTWATLMIGFAATGMALRRRKRRFSTQLVGA